MQKRCAWVIFALVVGTISVSASALNGPRPLAGHVKGYDEYGSECGGPGSFQLTSYGVGQITHLGKSLMVSPVCVGQDGNPIGTWTFTFTAANGDKVTGEVTGFTYTDYGFDLFATITGGTGRFAGATGELTFPTLSTGSGVWSSEIEGWITY